jgi:hypothetical protein
MDVLRLGAYADYVTEDEYRAELVDSPLSPQDVEEALDSFRRSVDISVQQFVVLVDGRRVVSTLEELTSDVLTTVLPDEDAEGNEPEEDHPWESISVRLRELGIEASPDELAALPYEVVFSDRLVARVPR